MVQRLRVGAQMPLGLAITARSQLGLLEGEIAREQGAEGLDRPCPDLLFLAGGIATERAGGKYVLSPPAGLARVERRHCAQGHSPRLAAVVVLNHPLFRAAGAQAHAEAREIVVEVRSDPTRPRAGSAR